MSKPDVRIIQNQQEEINQVEISQNERDMILSKYGFNTNKMYTEPIKGDELTFEEMCTQEERRLTEERAKRLQQKIGPKPVSFEGNYYSNEQYGTEPDSGFTFKVSVVSDMPIPKNY